MEVALTLAIVSHCLWIESKGRQNENTDWGKSIEGSSLHPSCIGPMPNMAYATGHLFIHPTICPFIYIHSSHLAVYSSILLSPPRHHSSTHLPTPTFYPFYPSCSIQSLIHNLSICPPSPSHYNSLSHPESDTMF
jgi:hypothetical protein